MLHWRLHPTLPPLRRKSAQHGLSEWEVPSDFTTDSRSERAWRGVWPVPQCVRPANTNTRHSTVTTQGPHPGNYAWPLSFNCPVQLESIWDIGRGMSRMRFIACYFSNDKAFPVRSVAEHSIQSMFNRQVSDRDVIGKAASNEPVKHSHRAIIGGLQLGLAPLTL